MVCRYMIEKLEMCPDEAITLFDTARGHEQERENYLQHLRSLALDKEEQVTSGLGALSLNQRPEHVRT